MFQSEEEQFQNRQQTYAMVPEVLAKHQAVNDRFFRHGCMCGKWLGDEVLRRCSDEGNMDDISGKFYLVLAEHQIEENEKVGRERAAEKEGLERMREAFRRVDDREINGRWPAERPVPVNGISDATISWDEHYEAWEAYHEEHPSQSAETIAQNNGFSIHELTRYLGHPPKTLSYGDPND